MTFYSAVSGAEEIRLVDSKLIGLAYPAQGPLCCALQLVSDGNVVRSFRADRFSEVALDRGLRDGWCGFGVEPAEVDFIFSDELILRCAKSLKRLFALKYDSWISRRRAPQSIARRVGTIESMLNGSSPRVECNRAAYWTLLERSTKFDDDRRFLERLFLVLFERAIDGQGLISYWERLRSGLERNTVYNEIVDSAEFASKAGGRFLSPFSEEFSVIPTFLPIRESL